MASSKDLRGQGVLPFLFDLPSDREAAIREIVLRILGASRSPIELNRVMLSLEWVGLKPGIRTEELKKALHDLVGQSAINRGKAENQMWIYSVKGRG